MLICGTAERGKDGVVIAERRFAGGVLTIELKYLAE
jgi:hypothetical protein